MAIRAILIAGPTASGKSALAMRLAEENQGEIVNADSMQVYRELRVITARPSRPDEARLPHHLYGVLSVREVCSAGRWIEMLKPVLTDIWGRQKVAVIVGGTGLYFRAALEGLAPVPDIPEDVRERGRTLLEQLGAEALHAELFKIDPQAAMQLRPTDPQRVVRAWEVLEATGKSLIDWQKDAVPGPLWDADQAGEVRKLALMPDRAWLYDRINRRFEQMVSRGGLEEAARLAEMDLPPDHPVMKALGIPSLIAHLRGEMSLEDAVADAQTQTRRYAKRQMTWIRHQFTDWERVTADAPTPSFPRNRTRRAAQARSRD